MEIKETRLSYPGSAPIRLDSFLAGQLNRYSRSFLKKVISEGGVSVDGKVSKPSRLLCGGETIIVRIEPPKPAVAEPENIPLAMIYEDAHLLAVDKPAGIVVHPAPGHPGGTLVNALLHHCRDLSGIGGRLRPGIVHRLDLGTSGVMVVAKNETAHRGMAAQFKDRQVRKIYKAVVFGQPTKESGQVDQPIGRDRVNRIKISTATDRPRSAVSRYSVEETFTEFALLTVSLLTGRTHQVRVHMAHLGHPLVGDSLYGGARWRCVRNPRQRAAAKSFGRPALHAAVLELKPPITGRDLCFEAPLAADVVDLLNALRKGGEF